MPGQSRRPLRKWLAAAVALAAVVALLFGLWWVGASLVTMLRTIDAEIAAAIVSGLAAVTIAIATTWLGRSLQRRTDARRGQQEKRVPVYEEFVKGVLQSMGISSSGKARKGRIDEQHAHRVLSEFTEKAIVWGSDDVLKAWIAFRTAGQQPEEYGNKILLIMEELFLAMRKDLGLSNRGLDRGDLLRLFINDFDPALLEPEEKGD